MKRTSGILTRPQRVVLYGVESVGKSTFASKFPTPLFIDIEQGSQKINVERWELEETEPTARWREVVTAIGEAKTTPHKTIVIDSIDALERIVGESLCAENKKKSLEDFGYGKGYVMVAERICRLLTTLDELITAGKNVVLIAHSRIVKFEAPDALAAYDRYELKLLKQCSPIVKEWADELWFLRFKTRVATSESGKGKGIGGAERIIVTTHAASHDAKTRSGLPEELPLDWESVKQIFEMGKPIQIEAPKKGGDFFAENAELINAFLISRAVIQEGQTYQDCDPSYIERINQRPEAFLNAAIAWRAQK